MTPVVVLVRRTEEGYRQRWRVKISYFSDKTQKSERRLLKSTGNRQSYKH